MDNNNEKTADQTEEICVAEPMPEPEPRPIRHELEDGAKAVVIPWTYRKKQRIEGNTSLTAVDKKTVVPGYSYLYNVQTDYLARRNVCKGDLLFLEAIQDSDMIEGRAYFLNSDRYGVIVRIYHSRDADSMVRLVDIYDNSDVYVVHVSDLLDVFDITSAMKTAPITDLNSNFMEMQIVKRDKYLDRMIEIQEKMIDELKASGSRIDNLIEIIAKKV